MISKVQPGQRIRAAQYNKLVDEINRLASLSTPRAQPGQLLPSNFSNDGGNTLISNGVDPAAMQQIDSLMYSAPLMLTNTDACYIFSVNEYVAYYDSIRRMDISDIPGVDSLASALGIVIFCRSGGVASINGVIPPIWAGQVLSSPNPLYLNADAALRPSMDGGQITSVARALEMTRAEMSYDQESGRWRGCLGKVTPELATGETYTPASYVSYGRIPNQSLNLVTIPK